MMNIINRLFLMKLRVLKIRRLAEVFQLCTILCSMSSTVETRCVVRFSLQGRACCPPAISRNLQSPVSSGSASIAEPPCQKPPFQGKPLFSD